MELGLKGKVAVVAAASQGLGLSIAQLLALEGCDLVIGSRRLDVITQVAEHISQKSGRQVYGKRVDVTKLEDCQALVQEAEQRFHRLDILVTNAGGPPPGMFMDLQDIDWQHAFELNLLSVVRLIRTAVPLMQNQGSIVNLISSSVKQPLPNLILSNSLRAAVTGLAKTLSVELADRNIRVNNVAPGRIGTERVAELDAFAAVQKQVSSNQIKSEWEERIPLGRYGTSDEFARMVIFLASDAASYITGSTVQVDGGMIQSLL